MALQWVALANMPFVPRSDSLRRMNQGQFGEKQSRPRELQVCRPAHGAEKEGWYD